MGICLKLSLVCICFPFYSLFLFCFLLLYFSLLIPSSICPAEKSAKSLQCWKCLCMDEAVQAICWFSAVFVNILFKWIKKMFASFCTHRTEGCGKCAACRQDTSRSCIKLTEREKSSVVSVRLQHRLCDESFSCYFFSFHKSIHSLARLQFSRTARHRRLKSA